MNMTETLLNTMQQCFIVFLAQSDWYKWDPLIRESFNYACDSPEKFYLGKVINEINAIGLFYEALFWSVNFTWALIFMRENCCRRRGRKRNDYYSVENFDNAMRCIPENVFMEIIIVWKLKMSFAKWCIFCKCVFWDTKGKINFKICPCGRWKMRFNF